MSIIIIIMIKRCVEIKDDPINKWFNRPTAVASGACTIQFANASGPPTNKPYKRPHNFANLPTASWLHR